MSKKSALDLKTLVLCLVIIVGLVLTIVGMFGKFIKHVTVVESAIGGGKTDPAFFKLSEIDKDTEGFAMTNVFAWVTFILVIVTLVLFAVSKLTKIKGLNLIVTLVGALTVVSAILVFIFAIVLASKMTGSLGVDGLAKGTAKRTISVGPILMLIGGLLAGGSAAASGKI